MKWYTVSSLFVVLLSVTWARSDHLDNADLEKMDFYDILGVGKDADNRQIRKAFKKLALRHHPDKNKAEDAQKKFMRINKAYETLKDEEKRNKYDVYGEQDDDDDPKENKQRRGSYQSWNYYQEDFGLYDEDAQVITLDYRDFRNAGLNSDFLDDSDQLSHSRAGVWLINFYSPQCGHCHDLAPVWRQLATTLENFVRVAAVNCQEDWTICRQQDVRYYPTIALFGPGQKRVYKGQLDHDDLLAFVANHVDSAFNEGAVKLKNRNQVDRHLTKKSDKQWLLMLCSDNDDCPMEEKQLTLAIFVLNHLVHVGQLADCGHKNKKLCVQLSGDQGLHGLFLVNGNPLDEDDRDFRSISLESSDMRGVIEEVMSLLTDLPHLDPTTLEAMVSGKSERMESMLLHFVFDSEKDNAPIFKKLPSLLPKLQVFRVDCKKHGDACRKLDVKKPGFALFKSRLAILEHYYGRRSSVWDVAEFARDSIQAHTFGSVNSESLRELLKRKKSVFVDFFAPWCPPCLHLLPEFRRASQMIGGDTIRFATVDCTIHSKICNEMNIRAYPTTIFFNGSLSASSKYVGEHAAAPMADFVQEILRPSVIDLDYNSYHALVGAKTEDELWVIDYYAPWCGPCQMLSGEWIALAKMLKGVSNVKVAKVDCTKEERLCRESLIRSYPSIRLFPMYSSGDHKYLIHTDHRRDAHSLREWVLGNLPEMVESLTPFTLQQRVIEGGVPALIDFYTPWCGPCRRFAPVFEGVALALQSEPVLVAKINCERFHSACRTQGIRAYPTLKLYYTKGNGVVSEELATQNPDAIVDIVKDRLRDQLGSKWNQRRLHDEL